MRARYCVIRFATRNPKCFFSPDICHAVPEDVRVSKDVYTHCLAYKAIIIGSTKIYCLTDRNANNRQQRLIVRTFYSAKNKERLKKKCYNQLFRQSAAFKSISNGHVQTCMFDISRCVNREKKNLYRR